MHRSIVPAKHKFAASEIPLSLLPNRHDLLQNRRQYFVKDRKATPEQQGEIDTLRIVVEFPPVNNEPPPQSPILLFTGQ